MSVVSSWESHRKFFRAALFLLMRFVFIRFISCFQFCFITQSFHVSFRRYSCFIFISRNTFGQVVRLKNVAFRLVIAIALVIANAKRFKRWRRLVKKSAHFQFAYAVHKGRAASRAFSGAIQTATLKTAIEIWDYGLKHLLDYKPSMLLKYLCDILKRVISIWAMKLSKPA